MKSIKKNTHNNLETVGYTNRNTFILVAWFIEIKPVCLTGSFLSGVIVLKTGKAQNWMNHSPDLW